MSLLGSIFKLANLLTIIRLVILHIYYIEGIVQHAPAVQCLEDAHRCAYFEPIYCASTPPGDAEQQVPAVCQLKLAH